MSYKNSDSSKRALGPVRDTLLPTNEFTICCWHRASASGLPINGILGGLGASSLASGDGIYAYQKSGSLNVVLRVETSTGGTESSALGPLKASGWNHIAVRGWVDAGSPFYRGEVFINGVPAAVIERSSGTMSRDRLGLSIGWHNSPGYENDEWRISHLMGWNRALPAGVLQQQMLFSTPLVEADLSLWVKGQERLFGPFDEFFPNYGRLEPFQVRTPSQTGAALDCEEPPIGGAPVFVVPLLGGGLTAYTLDAVSGSYALTGTAAALEHGRKLSADAGSFAVSGTAASLEHDRKLSAESGSFAVSGTAAALELGREVAAEAGSFGWTGTAATLLYSGAGYTLDPAEGSFTVTGSAANLELGRRLTAGAGAFALTGTAAGLEFARELAAASAVFSVTGLAASLELGRKLAAASAAFALTGTAAAMRHARAILAEAGTFVWTGSDATLDYSAGWSPSWGHEDRYRAELAASDVIAEPVASRTNIEIVSTGELAILEVPIHHWTFDDVYVDRIVSGFTFVPQTGSPSFESGVFGNAVRTSATARDLLIENKTAAEIDGASDFSLTGWAKGSTVDATSALFQTITPAWRTQVLHSGVSNYFRAVVAGQTGDIRAEAPDIDVVDAWYFWAVIWEELSDALKLYLGINGGVLTAYDGVENGWVGPRNTSGTQDIRAGYFSSPGETSLDDYRMYDVALNAGQVGQLYDEGLVALGL